MKPRNIYKFILTTPLLAFILLINGCYDNAWDNHAANNQLLGSSLAEAISSKAELSTFYSVLKKTGYDNVLKSADNFTVFAPTNSAWVGVDTTNVEKLKDVISNLIIYKSYFTDNEELYKTIKTVKYKNIYYDASSQTFNGAKIITADISTKNGALHVTDKITELKSNIWEFITSKTDNSQCTYIKSLSKPILDKNKSIQIKVTEDGPIYDTVWVDNNNFLNKYQLNNEDSLYTYVIVENAGFNMLSGKYKKYFQMSTPAATDSLTNFNVCQDFVFKGIVDITKADTLTNVDGVKVPIKGSVIKETYNSSNGRVYVIDQSNIKLKEKIKPIKIEGEAYYGSSNNSYVYTRYKTLASGERDIALACGETQSATLLRITTNKVDSAVSKSFYINSNLVANVENFSIRYSTQVNSANYDIYYVTNDDMADHYNSANLDYQNLKLRQKLFISLPGAPALAYGTANNARGVANNYLDNPTAKTYKCFVGESKAGEYKLTKLTQWNCTESSTSPQIVSTQVLPIADVMTVPTSGKLYMWLCNTARTNAASKQGLLFLDYILLVPRITE